MNPGMFINPGIIALRIHVFVDDHGQTHFGLVEPADDPEHLIHDRFNLLAGMMDQMTAVLSEKKTAISFGLDLHPLQDDRL